MLRAVASLLACSTVLVLNAHEAETAHARYIANMGVLIEQGDTKVLFDPLFKNDYGIYTLVPADTERAILDGVQPFDDIDAVFISHHHDDHFDPASIRTLLEHHSAIELFAPVQAAIAVADGVTDQSVRDRIHGLRLENGEVAQDVKVGPLLIEATRIPHAGWPDRHTDVENLVFRVTLDGQTSVTHYGDADAQEEHYTAQQTHWQERRTHFAMLPFWFFLSDEGRQIIEKQMLIDHAVGMHVPTSIPHDPRQRPAEVDGVDLFTKPGETRLISSDATSTDN